MERKRIVISKSAKRKMSSMVNGQTREKAGTYTEQVVYHTEEKLPNGKKIIHSRTRHEINYSK